MKGTVFNIQKMSLHDGPGMRTTVFLKGCPLSCVWCANPESQAFNREIGFAQTRCIECGYCATVCSAKVISSEPPFITIDRESCTGCMKCAEECCTNARRVIGDEYTPEELMEEIMKDKVFYDRSGGGVTFSGGEPFMQGDFLIEMLKLCRKKGLHTAVESCGSGNSEIIKEAAGYLGLIYFDLKHMDDEEHKRLTGASNQAILRNLKEIAKINPNIIVRTPVIPGLNDSVENIVATAEYAVSLGIEKYELLPYHELGKNKYRQVGLEYTLSEIKPPSEEHMQLLVEKASETGIECFKAKS